jgi:hypothetical protein
MADRDYDRNRYRRMYDDDERYGSGRSYTSGRDTDYDYDRSGRGSYGREGAGREGGYGGMTGRGSRGRAGGGSEREP